MVTPRYSSIGTTSTTTTTTTTATAGSGSAYGHSRSQSYSQSQSPSQRQPESQSHERSRHAHSHSQPQAHSQIPHYTPTKLPKSQPLSLSSPSGHIFPVPPSYTPSLPHTTSTPISTPPSTLPSKANQKVKEEGGWAANTLTEAKPKEMSRTQRDKERKKRIKARVVVEHVDVIQDTFWERRGWILSGKAGL
ncbi:hypothetical protein P154DRAFT_422158 [Amniculicola lignicola CBS 123094]|uniref:Uncharacterized protein n=1 Tax=Amniculicola lignicola CBS 123094 TaxID=1392246 RepID=A0A6A5X274_9PLEO|nr:hypothetical protein P154DRAFT_422158 [Amniculicola lignicola CBS 123094]